MPEPLKPIRYEHVITLVTGRVIKYESEALPFITTTMQFVVPDSLKQLGYLLSIGPGAIATVESHPLTGKDGGS